MTEQKHNEQEHNEQEHNQLDETYQCLKCFSCRQGIGSSTFLTNDGLWVRWVGAAAAYAAVIAVVVTAVVVVAVVVTAVVTAMTVTAAAATAAATTAAAATATTTTTTTPTTATTTTTTTTTTTITTTTGSTRKFGQFLCNRIFIIHVFFVTRFHRRHLGFVRHPFFLARVMLHFRFVVLWRSEKQWRCVRI